MNDRVRKHTVRALCVAMSATLIAGVIGTLPKGGTAPLFTTLAQGEGVQDVTGKVSTDNIRQQYLNTDLVKENVFAPDAENWIMVDFGGTSIMDDFIDGGAVGEFSDYVNTTAAIRKNEELTRKHKNFLNRLKNAGIEFECKYSFTTLTDAVAIRIKNADFDEVSAMQGVAKAYYIDSYAAPQAIAVDNDANAYPTGIYDSSALAGEPYNVQGEGMVVAILDTGIDASHKAFQNMPSSDTMAWNKEYVRSMLSSTTTVETTAGISVNDVYYNDKIPFAYDYADDDVVVYPSYSNHGTHVAGIVAGRDDSKAIEVVDEGQTPRTFVGVAPEAQLMICKVFTDNPDSRMLGGADGVDILAAISDCVTLGVDAINMSLGTSGGFTTPEEKNNMQEIYARVEEAGISLVVAASNDYSSGFGGDNGTNLASNPDSGTVGSPSTYQSAISVASIQGKKSRYLVLGSNGDDPNADTAVINETVDGNGNEYDFIAQIYEKLGEKDLTKAVTLNYVVVGGVGRSTNYTSSITRELQKGNTIALIKRGDITFAEKVQVAKANGALACIIYNNLSGTIRMSLGEEEDPIPTCSMGMDAGERLVAAATRNVGQVTICASYEAGPFMSDFSSWGPTPDLKLKPEITAHGGEIISAVPGGYDTMSGTSMASPNMAGAVTLLRQYVKQNNSEFAGNDSETRRALSARTYQLLMSTATMALNEEGNPYSPRKQGAGLASIQAAMDAESYITVKSVKSTNENGLNAYDLTGTTEAFNTTDAVDSDKVKVEFGDDKERRGVYDMTFTVHNQKSYAVSYTPDFYVMTETLASDLKTVAEKAHLLNPDIRVWVDGNETSKTSKITVAGSSSVNVRVQITLSGADKEYIESSFVNGMYVEGFVRLNAEGEKGATGNISTIDLGIPFLAFYGDWTDGPLFDYSAYEIAASEADTSVREEDKLKATAQATQPLGLYWNDSYVIPLGTYLYSFSPYDTEIYPSDERAAISAFDDTGARTVYELYMINTGLLRSAKEVRVTISDTSTGELVYSKTENNVSKSYAAGGSPRGATIMLRINPVEWGLASNKTYRLDMKGVIDYENGENVPEDTFSFEFTVDTEAPLYDDYRVRYEPYTENRVTKYRVYLDVDVRDNQYVMDGMACYLRDVKGEFEENDDGELVPAQQLSLLTEYPIPSYGQKGEVTTLSLEITDYYEDMVNHTGVFEDGLYFAVEDYAMNQSVFLFDITQARGYAEHISLVEDSKLTHGSYLQGLDPVSGERYEYAVYNLTLAPNESYNVSVSSSPDTTVAGAVYIRGSESVLAKERELFALGKSGETTLDVVLPVTATVQNESGSYTTTTVEKIVAQIKVKISGNARSTPNPESITLKPVFNASNWLDTLTGTLELHPNVTVQFEPQVTPWYVFETNEFEFEWESSNPEVMSVTDTGELTTHKRGTAYLTVRIKGNTRLAKSVRVEVTSEYDVQSGMLYNFYGIGDVVIPEYYNIMTIREDAFQYNERLTSITLPSTLTQIPEEAFKGCVNLEYVFIPSKCTYIGEAAFAGCTNLKTVVFGEFEDKVTGDHDVGTVTLGKNAFRNCTALDTIVNSVRITTAYDYAFSGCTALKEIDISGLRVAGRSVFGKAAIRAYEFGWSEIPASPASGVETVITAPETVFGVNMFDGCEALANVGEKQGESYVLSVARIPDGTFKGCTALESVTFGNDESNPLLVFGNSAFEQSGLKAITLPYGEYSIGSDAFLNSDKLATVTLSAGTHLVGIGSETFAGCTSFTAFAVEGSNPYHQVVSDILYTGSSKLECIPTAYATEIVKIPDGVTELGTGAFEGRKITSIDLSGVTKIGAYAFENCDELATVILPSGTNFVLEDGVFRNCVKLSSINLENVTKIGARTFEGCVALTAANIPLASEVGDLAFAESGVSSLTATSLKTVGNGAFRDANLVEALTLPVVETIGTEGFAGNKGLTSVSVGPVKEMGAFAFNGLSRITTFTMAEGGTSIGSYAFRGAYALKTVTLPSTIKTIGAYAFAEDDFSSNEGVETVVIPSGAEGVEIGDYAFYNCIKLEGIDLSHTSYIGTQAFAMERSIGSEATLRFKLGADGEIGASFIGAGAFAFAGLTQIYIDNAEILGSEAFTGNNLTRVTIPSTLREYNYEETWWGIADSGKPELVTGKQTQRYGGGVFANNASLVSITVAPNNPTFFSKDGVLYSNMAGGGYTLEQYPAGKAGKSYRILDDTRRIGFAAFLGAEELEEVTIPYSVRSIGSYAFFQAWNLTKYIFEGVEAPVLEASYTVDDAYFTDTYMYSLWSYGFYYTNFMYYGAYAMIYDIGLVISRPENGIGYEDTTLAYSTYFTPERAIKTVYAAERLTRETMDGITALPTADEIRSMVRAAGDKAAQQAEINRISKELVQPVRKNFNSISSARQKAFITAEQEKKLLDVEAAVRAIKSELGIAAKLTQLSITTQPNKVNYYVGEKFDATGMVVSAIYDDLSQVVVTNYTIDKTGELGLEDEVVTISYEGSSVPVYISVTAAPDEEKPKKGCKNAIAAEAAIAGAVVLAGAAALCVVLRRKKKD